MPPPVESDEFDTVSMLVDAAGYVKAAYDFILWAYGISETKEITATVARLAEEMTLVQQRLAAIEAQLNALTEEVVKIENTQRVLNLGEHAVSLQTLIFKLKNPANTADDFAAIAFEAGLRADQLLNNELWLWREVRKGPPITPLDAPDFKTAFALPVYSMALFTLAAAIVLRVNGNTQLVGSDYGAVLDRHIAAVSLRAEWRDEGGFDSATTLQEKVRVRLYCHAAAFTTYAQDGQCQFSVYGIDVIERKRTLLREIALPFPPGAAVLCTYDPAMLRGDEVDFEDNDPAVRLLELWREILTCVKHSAAFASRPFQGQFPNWTAVLADVYAVGQDGVLTLCRQVWPRSDGKFDQRVPVGTGWAGGTVAVGGGSVLYVGVEPGDWCWYRHTGAERPQIANTWQDRRNVLAGGPFSRGAEWLRNRRVFGGGYGVLYGIVQTTEVDAHGGHIMHGLEAGDLMWMKHEDNTGGSGGFGPEKKVGNGWQTFDRVFAMGEGVIYGLDPNGDLWWYRHNDYLDGGTSWTGRHIVRHGMDSFAWMFGAGQGLIYALYPNGRILCYRHLGWTTGDSRWDGPLELEVLLPNQYAIFAALPGDAGFHPPS
jgi:hypothetical protein